MRRMRRVLRSGWAMSAAVLIVAVGVGAEARSTGQMQFTEAPTPRRDPATLRAYRWEQVPGESLTLMGPYGIVWRLNFSADLTKPHFHPLKTSDGRLLSWVKPADHVWHYGLWHSWKLINGVNYWEEGEKTGRADGTTKLVSADVVRADDMGAEVRLRLAYHPANTPEAVVMEDIVTLTSDLPAEDGSYRLDWRQETRATTGSVTLDRTPLPEEPNGKPWGGYGGLSLRASRFLKDVTAVSSEGLQGKSAHRSRAAWLMMTGKINGGAVAVAIFDHPKNGRHPTRWFVELGAKEPFWYMNPAWLHDGPHTLSPGQTMVRRYRVRIDRERPDENALERERRDFEREET